MVDLSEKLLTLQEVTELLGVHYETVRGYKQGKQIGNKFVQLKTVRVGSHYRTSRADLATFLKELEEAKNPGRKGTSSSQPIAPTPADELTDTELRRLGIGV